MAVPSLAEYLQAISNEMQDWNTRIKTYATHELDTHTMLDHWSVRLAALARLAEKGK